MQEGASKANKNHINWNKTVTYIVRYQPQLSPKFSRTIIMVIDVGSLEKNFGWHLSLEFCSTQHQWL